MDARPAGWVPSLSVVAVGNVSVRVLTAPLSIEFHSLVADKINMVRPFLTLALVLQTALVSSLSFGSTGISGGDSCRRDAIETWLQANPGLDPEMKSVVAELERVVGPGLVQTRAKSPRACIDADSCVFFQFKATDSPRSLDLVIQLKAEGEKPTSLQSKTRITLSLPKGWHATSKADREFINRSLRGTSLHPYTDGSLSAFALKQSQKDAIDAYREVKRRGGREFMVVGPPGVGKTDVLFGIMHDRLMSIRAAKKTGRLVVFTTDRIDPVKQFGKRLVSMDEIEVRSWGGGATPQQWTDLQQELNQGKNMVLLAVLPSFKQRLGTDPGMESVLRDIGKHVDAVIFDEVQHISADQTQPFMFNLLNRSTAQAATGEVRMLIGGTCVPRHLTASIDPQDIFKKNQFWMYRQTVASFVAELDDKKPFRKFLLSDVIEQYKAADRSGEIHGVRNAYLLGDTVPSSKGPVPVFVRNGNGVTDLNPKAMASIGASLEPLIKTHDHVFIRVPSQAMADVLLRHIEDNREVWGIQHPVFTFHSATPIPMQTKVRTEHFEAGKPATIILVDRTEGLNFIEANLGIDLTPNTEPWAFMNFMGRITRVAQGKAEPTLVSFGRFEEGSMRDRWDLLQLLRRPSADVDHPSAFKLPPHKKGTVTDDTEKYLAALAEMSESRLKRQMELIQYHVWRDSLPEALRARVTDKELKEIAALDAHLEAIEAYQRLDKAFYPKAEVSVVISGSRENLYASTTLTRKNYYKNEMENLTGRIKPRELGSPFTDTELLDEIQRLAAEASLDTTQTLFGFLDTLDKPIPALAVLWTRARLSKVMNGRRIEDYLEGRALLPPSLRARLKAVSISNAEALNAVARHINGEAKLQWNWSQRLRGFKTTDLRWNSGSPGSDYLKRDILGSGTGLLTPQVRAQLPDSTARLLEDIIGNTRSYWPRRSDEELDHLKRVRLQFKLPTWLPREVEVLVAEIKDKFPELKLSHGRTREEIGRIFLRPDHSKDPLLIEWGLAMGLRNHGYTARELLKSVREDFPKLTEAESAGLSRLQIMWEQHSEPWGDLLLLDWDMPKLVEHLRMHHRLPDILLRSDLSDVHLERIQDLAMEHMPEPELVRAQAKFSQAKDLQERRVEALSNHLEALDQFEHLAQPVSMIELDWKKGRGGKSNTLIAASRINANAHFHFPYSLGFHQSRIGTSADHSNNLFITLLREKIPVRAEEVAKQMEDLDDASFDTVKELVPELDPGTQAMITAAWTRLALEQVHEPKSLWTAFVDAQNLPIEMLERYRRYNTDSHVMQLALDARKRLKPSRGAHALPVRDPIYDPLERKMERWNSLYIDSMHDRALSPDVPLALARRVSDYQRGHAAGPTVASLEKIFAAQPPRSQITRELEVIVPELVTALGIGSDKEVRGFRGWQNGFVAKDIDLVIHERQKIPEPLFLEFCLAHYQRLRMDNRRTLFKTEKGALSEKANEPFLALKNRFYLMRQVWDDNLIPGWDLAKLSEYVKSHHRLPDDFLRSSLSDDHLDRILEYTRIYLERAGTPLPR